MPPFDHADDHRRARHDRPGNRRGLARTSNRPGAAFGRRAGRGRRRGGQGHNVRRRRSSASRWSAAPPCRRASHAGRPVAGRGMPTLADSLGGGIGLDNRLHLRMCRDLLDEVVLLSEDEIAAGIRHAYRAGARDRRRCRRGRHRARCSPARSAAEGRSSSSSPAATSTWTLHRRIVCARRQSRGARTMSRMTILTEAELRKIVQLDLDAVACVENAFARWRPSLSRCRRSCGSTFPSIAARST